MNFWFIIVISFIKFREIHKNLKIYYLTQTSIGKAYNDKGANKNCFRSKKKMSKNVRMKVDLTKKRFTIVLSANEYVRTLSLIKLI